MIQPGDAPRVETRFTGTALPVSPLPPNTSEIHYPTKAVSTLVFGRQSPQDGVPVPLGGTLRFRYYSPDAIPSTHEVSVLDPRQIGTLMLKHYGDADTVENRKCNLANVALGDACRFLEDPDLRDGLAQYEGGLELIRLIEEHYGSNNPIMPLMVVEARRRHLSVEEDVVGLGPARITFDQDTTWWPVVDRKPGDVLAVCRALTLPENILEVKRPEPLDPASDACRQLLTRLFGDEQDYIPQGRLKRLVGRSITETRGTPRLINGGWEQHAMDPLNPNEIVRFVDEKEIKIDTNTDPRDAIRTMSTRPRDGFWVDPGFPRKVSFRFHVYEGGDESIVAVEKHNFSADNELLGVGFQYKRPVSDGSADGVLARSEIMAPSLAELWGLTGKVPGKLIGTTQWADRDRIHRRVVCEETGNVFLILADYCATESDDRPPLAQVEIEFRGKYGFNDMVSTVSDEERVTADFEHVREMVVEALGAGDVVVTGGQTTKQAWLTARA